MPDFTTPRHEKMLRGLLSLLLRDHCSGHMLHHAVDLPRICTGKHGSSFEYSTAESRLTISSKPTPNRAPSRAYPIPISTYGNLQQQCSSHAYSIGSTLFDPADAPYDARGATLVA